MKGFRGTFVFALIVLGIGGYAIWEFKKGQTEEDAKVKEAQLLGAVNAEEVTEFSFKNEAGGYELKKDGGEWKTITPVADIADEDAILTHIRNISGQNAEVVEAEGGGALSWEKFGLDKPAGEFIIKTAAAEIKLQVGRERSYDQGFYIRKNMSNELIVVGSSLESALGKSASEFRSKKIRIPYGETKGLRYNSSDAKKGGSFEYNKIEGLWILKQKPKLKISSSAVNDYANSLQHIRADSIVADKKDASSLKQYGLQNPTLTLALSLRPDGADEKAAAKEVKILFAAKGESDVFITSTENEPIYKITRGRYEEFLKTSDDFRDKQFPFAYDQFKPVVIKIKSKNETKVLEKVEENWADAVSPHVKVKQDEVKALLGAFLTLKAEEFLPNSGAKFTAENSYEFVGQDGLTVFMISLGAVQKAKNGYESYVVKTSFSDELMLVTKSSLDEITPKSLFEEEKVK